VSHVAEQVRATAERLRADRRPFVAATVVRAEKPTSAKAGDTALVFDDGTVLGFVGGECAQVSVQTQALASLLTGEPVLLTISPDGPSASEGPTVAHHGAVTVHNQCLSGGTLEIFLEPAIPPPLMVVHGDAPIARAVRELAAWMGYGVQPTDGSPSAAPTDPPADADAVVIATHGGDETIALRGALDAGVPYIGLVASGRRGATVLDAMELSDSDRARVSVPAGLDIGSHGPEEVALSILAEYVSRRESEPSRAAAAVIDEATAEVSPATAIDPVCGMSVVTIESSRHVDHEGSRCWFCGSGCEQAFRADPSRFTRS
jgi:xanthine dehydrogenase accessory factor